MKAFEPIFEIINLLKKELSGTITEPEKSQLKEWEKDSRILSLLEKFNRESYLEKKFSELDRYDAKQAFDEFYERVQKTNPKHRLYQLLKYAAVLIIPLLFAGYLIWNANLSEPGFRSEMINAPIIKPGNQIAKLFMADGQSLLLGRQSDTLIESKTFSIQATKGAITYKTNTQSASEELLYNTAVVPRGGEISLLLSDGTKVWLNSESELKYPVAFATGYREVKLKGEAYFEVTSSKSKPFYVTTSEGQIKVTGTHFNVRDYEDEAHTYTTLVEGKVSIRSLCESGNYLSIEPGYQAIIKKGSPDIEKKAVDVTLFTAWKDGLFKFDRQPLENILQTLSRWYNIDIFYESEQVKNYVYSGDLERYDNINQFLIMIEKTGNAKFRIIDNAVVVDIKN